MLCVFLDCPFLLPFVFANVYLLSYSMNTYPNFAGITVVIQFKYQVEQRRCFDLTITLAVVPDLQNVALETPSLG